ncbi:response regulator [Perlabentimonas gracilis]|uniref:response regulator n=1 Tax=Perlabentimonas gracilis TaxID=2715279 RepID=UPI00140A8490|nr:response regulator [Perlabentimonas gracilis]
MNKLKAQMMFDTTNIQMQQRILIIDDDRELAQSIREILVEEGFRVDMASNGREGIRLQNTMPYELIITDIVMPEEDGLEVIMWVRKTHPNTKLIAISGGGYFDSRDYLLMAKELGAKIVLCKPFEIKSLLSGVRRLLGIEKPA